MAAGLHVWDADLCVSRTLQSVYSVCDDDADLCLAGVAVVPSIQMEIPSPW